MIGQEGRRGICTGEGKDFLSLYISFSFVFKILGLNLKNLLSLDLIDAT